MEDHPTVYIIDDDKAFRNSLVWLLESVSIKTAAYPSAMAFLSEFDASSFACIIADLRMPEMSGLELQAALIDRNITVPFILMTAFGDVSTAVKSMKAGATDFVEKPFNNQEVLDLVNRVLAKEKSRRADLQKADSNFARIATLTPQEFKVFDLVGQGLSNKEIGSTIAISVKTVEAHRAQVMKKLNLKSIVELVQLFLEYKEQKN